MIINIKVKQKSFSITRTVFEDNTGFKVIQYVGDGFLLRVFPQEQTLVIENLTYSPRDAINVCRKLEKNFSNLIKE
jgi:hypothetical protein